MLEMTKLVLDKVSDNRELFGKELRKSTKWLERDEMIRLKVWCYGNYGREHGALIKDIFATVN